RRVTRDTTGSGTGGVLTWNYSVLDSGINYLRDLHSFPTRRSSDLFDGTSTVSKDVTVTITGTNDNAIISVGSGDHDTGAVKEDAQGLEAGVEKTSGTLSFSDVDLTNQHAVSLVTASSGALGTLTASVTHDTTGSGPGGVMTWNYSVPDSAINYLAEGQTKVETFTIFLFDATSMLSLSLHDALPISNDNAIISVGSGDHDTGAVKEDAQGL